MIQLQWTSYECLNINATTIYLNWTCFSMGGAIAVHTAHRELIPTLIGLAVIDVVEGNCGYQYL